MIHLLSVGGVLDTFLFTSNVVLPIILMIGMGYYLKKIKFVNDNFLGIANKLCFKLFLPLMLFVNIYNIGEFSDINWAYVLYPIAVIFAIFAVGVVIVKYLVKEPKQKGVILQCFFRSNYAIIGIPLATSICGVEGAAVASIISAISIPVFNILAVVALSVYVPQENVSRGKQIKKMLLEIVTNPLLIGVFAGILTLVIRGVFQDNNISFKLSDVDFFYSVIKSFASVTTPLALIVLGGNFELSDTKSMGGSIILGTVMRVAIVPISAISIACLLYPNMESAYLASYVALFGSPVAVSSAIMAKSMKNDDILAGQLVFWTTVASAVTLFVIIYTMKFIGIV